MRYMLTIIIQPEIVYHIQTSTYSFSNVSTTTHIDVNNLFMQFMNDLKLYHHKN